MYKNKGFILVTVVLLAIFGFWLMGRESGPTGESPEASPTSSPAAGAPGSGSQASPNPVPDSGALTKSYTEYVQEYEGRRIQFDDNCRAIPNNVTFKEGTWIMLDNRSSEPRTITIGDRSFDLQGYGYWLTPLSSSILPQELPIGCGSQGTVGNILLQARLF